MQCISCAVGDGGRTEERPEDPSSIVLVGISGEHHVDFWILSPPTWGAGPESLRIGPGRAGIGLPGPGESPIAQRPHTTKACFYARVWCAVGDGGKDQGSPGGSVFRCAGGLFLRASCRFPDFSPPPPEGRGPRPTKSGPGGPESGSPGPGRAQYVPQRTHTTKVYFYARVVCRVRRGRDGGSPGGSVFRCAWGRFQRASCRFQKVFLMLHNNAFGP